MLIEQSGQQVPADPQHPQNFVQSVIDALCDLSSRDPLTGLSNRRSFTHVLEQELDRVARLGDDALLLMVDVDHFKRINDTHGHVVGDAVLRQLAARLLECVRPMDTVARFGGEEFAIVLPNCSHSYAEVVAERVRQSVASLPICVAGLSLPVTVSVGGGIRTPVGALRGGHLGGEGRQAALPSQAHRSKPGVPGRNLRHRGVH